MDYFTCGYNKKDFENERIKALCNSYRLFQAQEKKVKDEEYIKNLLEEDYVDKIRAINTNYDMLNTTIKVASNYIYSHDKKDEEEFNYLEKNISDDFFGREVHITDIMYCGIDDHGYKIMVMCDTQLGSRFFALFIPKRSNITVRNYKEAHHGQFMLFEVIDKTCLVEKCASYDESEIKKWFTDNIVHGEEIILV